MTDLLAERFARRDAAAHERAERLRARLPELAAALVARGASRVVAFGSLVTGKKPHAGTDIDLAVEGMSESALADAALDLEGTVEASLDLVRLEDASSALRARVAREGKELARVTG